MNRRRSLLIGLLAVLFTGLVIAWMIGDQRRVVAEARSPDGSWGVAIVGQKLLLGLGGIEVIIEIREGNNRPLPYPGTFVVGNCGHWSEARAKFGAVTCSNSQAVADGRTLLKKNYIGR